jgi:hypothetical protein
MSKIVLMAVQPEEMQFAHKILTGYFDYIVCHTLSEATASLSTKIGVITCGVRFFDGAVFEFLRAAKAHPETSQVPFFLLPPHGTVYSHSVVTGVRKAAELLGAQGFLSAERLPVDYDEEALRTMRATITQALQRPQKSFWPV